MGNKTNFRISIIIAALLCVSKIASSQVMVDSKNISADDQIQYLQFSYYLEQKSFKPVYMIDYGIVEQSESGKIKAQKISINNEEIKDNMSPVYVMNKLAEAGWVYEGDGTYIRMPLSENVITYTFVRKPEK